MCLGPHLRLSEAMHSGFQVSEIHPWHLEFCFERIN
jgi:hypothetical protein